MNSSTQCYRFKLIKTGERVAAAHGSHKKSQKSPSVPETSSETCLFTFSFGLNRRTPAGTADRGKIVKNLASLTHTCTHGDGEMHIFHTTVNGIPFRIHTCNASICSHKPGQNSISNRKKKKTSALF